MNILITGGLGNLGLWLTYYFLDLGHNVTVLGRSERVIIRHQNYNFLCTDITDINSLKSSINCYYDACIHTASFNEHFKANYTEDALRINSLGTEFLCQALVPYGVGKLVYLSTFHVYGIKEGVVTESSPVSPDNDYALTHYFAEKYIEKNAKNYGLNYIIFRLTNSYGCPKDINSDKWYLVLNDLCRQAHENETIKLTSNGKALRDFIWMGDVAQVIDLSLKDISLANDIFNLSSGKTFSILELSEYVQSSFFELYHKDITMSVNYFDKSEPKYLVVSNEKIQKNINYSYNNCFKDEAKKILLMLGKS